MAAVNYRNTEIMQTSSKCRPVVPGKDMTQLLYDLISTTTPHGHEPLLFPIMSGALTPFAKNISLKFIDKAGNLYIRIGARKDSDTMFSCHMDTSHAMPAPGTEPALLVPMIVDYDGGDKESENSMIYGARSYLSKAGKREIMPSILGADDKVGVYILIRMIQKNIPGLYVFHVGEERGCIGSKWSSEHNKSVFKGYKRCIAYDRMNYGDIITQQRGKRTASKLFSQELADAFNSHLNTKVQAFKPDVVGMYTDSANYTGLIPECTNVSVGYWDQHGTSERFDLIWLEQIFLPALLKVDYEKLITSRKLTDPDYPVVSHGGNNVHNTTKKKIDEVTMETNYYDIPYWGIDEGLLAGIDDGIMLRIIEARVKNTLYTDQTKFAKEIFEFLKRYQSAIDAAEEEEVKEVVGPKKNQRAVKLKGESSHAPSFLLGPAAIAKIKEIQPETYRSVIRTLKIMDGMVSAFAKIMEAYDRSGNSKATSLMHVAVAERRIKLLTLLCSYSKNNVIPIKTDLDVVRWNLLDLTGLIAKLPNQALPLYLRTEIMFITTRYTETMEEGV